MLLKNLINNIPKDKRKIIISGLSSDSREVKKNCIFFAIKGNKINGENFIKNAVKKGASVLFVLKHAIMKIKKCIKNR